MNLDNYNRKGDIGCEGDAKYHILTHPILSRIPVGVIIGENTNRDESVPKRRRRRKWNKVKIIY